MNTKIKICGIRREEDIRYVNELKPDYVGFVFAPSRRRVAYEEAFFLRGKMEDSIPAVGVFVNEVIEKIAFLAKKGTIQIAQLHGGEGEAYIRKLKEVCQIPIIKVIRIGKDDLKQMETQAEYLLFDSAKGGSGETFCWEKISNKIKKPIFLAGGLKIENIEQAIQQVKPYAVDISSGVETDGNKDYAKMKEIFRRIEND